MKKAISPLIATILLIVVSLALIAIILSWGSNFVTKNTNEADNSIDRSCSGAYIDFISCSYDETENQITASIINTGKFAFKEGYAFNIVLKDANDVTDLTYTDVFDSEKLEVSESRSFVLEDYNGTSPVTLSIRSSMCPINYWETNCS